VLPTKTDYTNALACHFTGRNNFFVKLDYSNGISFRSRRLEITIYEQSFFEIFKRSLHSGLEGIFPSFYDDSQSLILIQSYHHNLEIIIILSPSILELGQECDREL
jgi:hypothetical protein